MKINEYNQMMAHLTRPAKTTGGRVGLKTGSGRIGLAQGTMTPSEKWMRNYFFSEKGEPYENRMSIKQFMQGPGKDLWYRLGKK